MTILQKISQVVAEATPWVGGTVAISNFGFGGSNVHCLVSGRGCALTLPKALPVLEPAAVSAAPAAVLDPMVSSL